MTPPDEVLAVSQLGQGDLQAAVVAYLAHVDLCVWSGVVTGANKSDTYALLFNDYSFEIGDFENFTDLTNKFIQEKPQISRKLSILRA